jgi:hypothetical protein
MSQSAVDTQNAAISRSTFRPSTVTGFGINREWFLGNLACVAGLDLYIVADRTP